MNRYLKTPAARIGAFASLVGLTFAAAAIAGAAIDPDVEERGTSHPSEDHAGDGPHGSEHSEGPPPGLAVSQSGYTLETVESRLAPGKGARFEFSISGPDGQTVRDFGEQHERRMHMIAVRRDLEAFQHVHPEQASDGSWSVEIDTRLPGTYRVFADFMVEGTPLTLGTDVFVSGRANPVPLPRPATQSDAGDGYRVSLTGAEPHVGANPMSFEVTRNGEPIQAQPYLGADGHLVALREHDLAFLHTHPGGEPGDGGPIEFEVAYPTAGNYRLFLQFKHGGEVHTAAFTQEVHDGGH
ncbi:MAG TPA: hypothetical protein VD766_13900 [Solirubrobacterales bacterium]|nr:hypothetical protein [Solirubrobacterales bacterium]